MFSCCMSVFAKQMEKNGLFDNFAACFKRNISTSCCLGEKWDFVIQVADFFLVPPKIRFMNDFKFKRLVKMTIFTLQVLLRCREAVSFH